MTFSASDLPDDVDALKAMIVAMSAEGAAARAEITRLEALKKDTDERIATLTAIVKVLERAQKGRRSERLRLGINDDQIDFAFEEVETGLAAIDSELDQSRKDKPKREARPRKGFAAHL
ncbi:transposase, partial [Sinorhizobium medicae]|uniref:transposase n=2 Tax=Rhizobiaceae TaxID=82115 RepID=UPI000FE0FCC9